MNAAAAGDNHMFRRELAWHLKILSGWDMVEIVLVVSLAVSFVAEANLY